MKNYEQFQNAISSEKITLAILNGANQLVAWTIHDENIYKKTLDVPVLSSLKVNGLEYTAVNTVAELTEDTYFNDRDNGVFYIYNVNPNDRTKIIVLTQKYFFSNKAITLPHDLNTGFDVYFEPMISRTTEFGNELDIADEGLSAIEGSGTLTLLNDFNFWQNRFDKISFDNELCSIYSFNSSLEAHQAKLLYTGYVESKSYDSTLISFKLKDLLYNLRNTITLKNVSELGYRNKPAFDEAKQRLVYGQVKGFRPTNLDALIDNSYPIKGTISVFFDSNIVVGTDTSFISQLIPNDKLIIKGVQYTIAEITSDTSLSLTSNYNSISEGNFTTEVVPFTAKSYINRNWLLSGHALSQPTVTIQAGSSTSRLVLSSTKDLFDGDDIYIGEIGSGELVKINKVINDQVVTLGQSTEIIYSIDTPVHRPCVQNLKMNDLELVYLEDYNVDPNAGILNIFETAEENRSIMIESTEYITCANGSDIFTGFDTNFLTYLKIGDKVRPKDTDQWFTVKELSDDEIVLTENYSGTSFTTAEPIPEITAISGLSILRESYTYRANTTANIQGKFFKIWNKTESVAVWFDLGNVGTAEPVHNCDSSIEVTSINAGDSDNTILTKVAQRLNREDSFSCTIVGDLLHITQTSTGVRPAAKTPTAEGFEALSISKTQQKIKCVADVGDSLDATGFYLYDNLGLVYFWYGIDGNSNANPIPTGNFRQVMIGSVNTDDDAATVRDKTKAAIISDGYFAVSDLGVDSFIASGALTNISNGSMPAGHVVAVIQNGASSYELNNKYFIIPFYDLGAATTKLHGFWFNVDSSGMLPTFTSDYTTEVQLDSSFTEEEVFEAIANAAEATTHWANVDYTESSITLTDANNKTLSAVFDVGTSELTISQAQAGVTVNPFDGKRLQYKNYVFDDSKDVLSCDVYGKTDAEGNLLRYAPSIVKDLITQSGLTDFIDDDSFNAASDYFNEELAVVFPESYSSKSINITYRDAINHINGSVFGVLLQSNDFLLQYESIRPQVLSSMIYLNEADVLSLDIDVSSAKMVLDTSVGYGFKEATNISSVVAKNSISVKYISKKSTSRQFTSGLVNEVDAQRLANRWSFLLENSSNTVNIQTKIQTIQMQIGDVFQLSHSKLPARYGSQGNIRLLMVQSISKSASGVTIQAVDLSTALDKVAKITDAVTSWDESSSDTKLVSGYYTDENGLISIDENSFYTNLIW